MQKPASAASVRLPLSSLAAAFCRRKKAKKPSLPCIESGGEAEGGKKSESHRTVEGLSGADIIRLDCKLCRTDRLTHADPSHDVLS